MFSRKPAGYTRPLLPMPPRAVLCAPAAADTPSTVVVVSSHDTRVPLEARTESAPQPQNSAGFSARPASPTSSTHSNSSSRQSISSPANPSQSRQSSSSNSSSAGAADSPSKQRARSSAASTRSQQEIKRRRETGYFIEVVYEDPNDYLQEAPRHRIRRDGDSVGDILFFGDDVMFGSHNLPFPELLRDRLAQGGLRLVVNAMPGRTSAVNDDALASTNEQCLRGEHFNGMYQFGTAFSSHCPLWVVFGLGSNDCKSHLRMGVDVTAESIAAGVGRLVAHARLLFTGHCHDGELKICVLVPPVLRLTADTRALGFDVTSVAISHGFAMAFALLGDEHDVTVIHPPADAREGWPNGYAPGSLQHSSSFSEAVWAAIQRGMPRKAKRW
jgi:hypothetical protein